MFTVEAMGAAGISSDVNKAEEDSGDEWGSMPTPPAVVTPPSVMAHISNSSFKAHPFGWYTCSDMGKVPSDETLKDRSNDSVSVAVFIQIQTDLKKLNSLKNRI